VLPVSFPLVLFRDFLARVTPSCFVCARLVHPQVWSAARFFLLLFPGSVLCVTGGGVLRGSPAISWPARLARALLRFPARVDWQCRPPGFVRSWRVSPAVFPALRFFFGARLGSEGRPSRILFVLRCSFLNASVLGQPELRFSCLHCGFNPDQIFALSFFVWNGCR
jgi:hypothetical protein